QHDATGLDLDQVNPVTLQSLQSFRHSFGADLIFSIGGYSGHRIAPEYRKLRVGKKFPDQVEWRFNKQARKLRRPAKQCPCHLAPAARRAMPLPPAPPPCCPRCTVRTASPTIQSNKTRPKRSRKRQERPT